jgi:hypothetical protein
MEKAAGWQRKNYTLNSTGATADSEATWIQTRGTKGADMTENKLRTFKLDMPETVTRACRVSGGSLPKDFSVVVPLSVDYKGCNGAEVSGWAVRSNVIEWQGAARGMTPEFLRKLSKEGALVHARNCKAFVDPARRVMELVADGMPEAIANLAVFEPVKYNKLMEGVLAGLGDKS